MDEFVPLPPPSPWKAAIICSAVLLIVIVAGTALVRTQLLVRISADDVRARNTITQLEKRIEGLESRLTTLAQAAQPDPAPMEALKAAVESKDHQIVTLTERIEALEKKPVPVAPAPVVVAPPAPVTPPAPAVDVAAEAALRTQLQEILATIPAENPAEPHGLAARINRNLSGLVSIKKQSTEDVYARLRARVMTASIPALLREVEQLPPTAQEPLTAWITHAREITQVAP